MALLAAIVFSTLGFMLSASAGMGGSLIIVPALVLIYGAKSGVALAACLLAANNVFKVIAYRKTIPWSAAAIVIGMTAIGAAVGAALLLRAPETLVQVAVLLSVIGGFALNRMIRDSGSKKAGIFFSLAAGLTSGFSGTSGPLKGVALKSLKLDHFYLVGAASVVSLTGDLVKASIYSKAELITGEHVPLIIMLVPLMPVATFLGRKINRSLGEKYFGYLFWAVMAGYAVRLLIFANT